MNEFVNYEKRDVSLPKGCVDLIDVLRGKTTQKSCPPPREIKTERVAVNGLAHLGRYVRNFLESSDSFVMIYQSCHEPVCVLQWTQEGPSVVLYFKSSDVFRAERARRICGEAGLLPQRDIALDPQHILLFALPKTDPQATQLIDRLLREVYDISDEAGITFDVFE